MKPAVISSTKGARKGTAKRSDGRDTAAKIITTAYDLLISGGYADFSMRNIADKAGIRLANLQYYYPKKDDLIQALLTYVGELYDERYAQCLLKAGDSPQERFNAVLEFNLEDINNLDTRHFFIQFWPLLGIADNYSGKLLAKLYAPQLNQFGELITDLHPDVSAEDVALRAELIAALMDGLMVVAMTPEGNREKLEKLKQLAILASNQIAAGTV
jgi:AcrR family transcriptional regulator